MDLRRAPSATNRPSHLRGWSLTTATVTSFESTPNGRVPIGKTQCPPQNIALNHVPARAL